MRVLRITVDAFVQILSITQEMPTTRRKATSITNFFLMESHISRVLRKLNKLL